MFDFWQKNTSVKTLILRSNRIGDAGAAALAKALEVGNQLLRCLCILKMATHMLPSPRPQLAAAANRVFVFDFWQNNTCVTSVNLGYNEIGNEGAQAIADMLGVGFQLLVTPHTAIVKLPAPTKHFFMRFESS